MAKIYKPVCKLHFGGRKIRKEKMLDHQILGITDI